MHDELVKALRCCGSEDRCKGCPRENAKTKCYDDICIEAADAIEELSKLNAEITRRELKLRMEKPRWIPVTEDTPSDFVSVQAHMTDAGNFPSVREAYTIDKMWFFPALKEFHPVDKWRRLDEPAKEE